MNKNMCKKSRNFAGVRNRRSAISKICRCQSTARHPKQKLSREGKFVELTVQSYSSAFFKKLWVFLGSKTTLRCTSCLLPTGLFGYGSQV